MRFYVLILRLYVYLLTRLDFLDFLGFLDFIYFLGFLDFLECTTRFLRRVVL